MVRNLLQVRLHKTQTLTDWRRRPLSPEQVEYAAEDVMYLVAVHHAITARLQELGRIEWMQEEMARFAAPETYQRDPASNLFKLKGAGALDAKGLAVARELVKARESLARQYNRPARAVVRDHLLVEIARHRWTSVARIKALRGLNLRASAVRILAEAVQQACELPPDQWPSPPPPKDETEQEAALALLARAAVHAYCAEHSLSPQLVASKQDIRTFVRALARDGDPGQVNPLGDGWRGRSVGAVICELLRGKASIKVADTKAGRCVIVR
jgi:ribonuclease D